MAVPSILVATMAVVADEDARLVEVGDATEVRLPSLNEEGLADNWSQRTRDVTPPRTRNFNWDKNEETREMWRVR